MRLCPRAILVLHMNLRQQLARVAEFATRMCTLGFRVDASSLSRLGSLLSLQRFVM